MKTLIVLLTACLGLNAPAASQVFSGLKSVKLAVEKMDADAIACNVSKDALDAAARIVLSNSRIQVFNEETAAIHLYIAATIVRDGNTCIASTKVALFRPVWLRPGAQEMDYTIGQVWEKGALLSGHQANFGVRVSTNIEQLTKQFVGAWLKEN